MIEVMDLLGIPYKENGRDRRGFDCYGLAIEICKRFGRKLIDLTNRNKEEFADLFNIIQHGYLRKIKKCDCGAGDLIVFFDIKGRVYHIGVALYENDYIHCNRYGVHISKLKNARNFEVYEWLN